MYFRDACIPVRLGWSSPFARWQGPLAELSSIDLAVKVAVDALSGRGLPASEVTGIVFGWTVPQPEIFYGASTVAARIGAPHATGAMLSQACATSAACLEAAALRVDAGLDELSMVIATDRTSNGPVLTYPSPSSPGGAPQQEHWVLDSFRRDPDGTDDHPSLQHRRLGKGLPPDRGATGGQGGTDARVKRRWAFGVGRWAFGARPSVFGPNA